MKYLKGNIDKPFIFSIAGDFTADDKWSHMERIINNYELIIMNKGTTYIQEGNEKYELNPGDILLLEPELKHKGYAYSDKGTTFYWVHFTCNQGSKILTHNEAVSDIAMAQNNPYFNELNANVLIPKHIKNLNLDRVNILFRQLLHLSQSNYYTKQSVNYILTSILIEITQQVISNFKLLEKNTTQQDQLQKILQWIGIHTSQNISLQDVAHEFNFSREYLSRYFKKKMGMSMQNYINYLRVSDAKRLLCNSDLNIKEISQHLGFIDEKYFLKLFKKYENVTPKQFRNAYNMTFLNNI